MSVVVTKVVAVFILTIGLSYVVQGRRWLSLSKDLMEAPHRMFPLSILMVVLGSVIVAVHNEWSVGWDLVTTVLGWVLLLKGVTLLVYPQLASWAANMSNALYLNLIRVSGVLLTVLGLTLTYRTWL